MKNKILSVMFAATTACVAVIGIAACSENIDDGFVGLKSDKVSSATEWAAAFDYSTVSNVTITYDDFDSDIVETLFYDGNKDYVYVAEYARINDGRDIKISVKIKDEKAVEMTVTGTISGGSMDGMSLTISYRIYDFGTTVVTLPVDE